MKKMKPLVLVGPAGVGKSVLKEWILLSSQSSVTGCLSTTTLLNMPGRDLVQFGTHDMIAVEEVPDKNTMQQLHAIIRAVNKTCSIIFCTQVKMQTDREFLVFEMGPQAVNAGTPNGVLADVHQMD